MLFADMLREQGLRSSTIKVMLASISSIAEILQLEFPSGGKAVGLLLKGMQTIEGQAQEGPGTLPSEWGTVINPEGYQQWDWRVKQAVAKVVIAQFFGWRASSV